MRGENVRFQIGLVVYMDEGMTRVNEIFLMEFLTYQALS